MLQVEEALAHRLPGPNLSAPPPAPQNLVLWLDIPWQQQIGPVSGITALRMSEDYSNTFARAPHNPANPDETPRQAPGAPCPLLAVARARGHSLEGEIYSPSELARVAIEGAGMHAFEGPFCPRLVLESILRGAPVVVPYDRDEANADAPGLNGGRSTHWGLVKAMLFPAPTDVNVTTVLSLFTSLGFEPGPAQKRRISVAQDLKHPGLWWANCSSAAAMARAEGEELGVDGLAQSGSRQPGAEGGIWRSPGAGGSRRPGGAPAAIPGKTWGPMDDTWLLHNAMLVLQQSRAPNQTLISFRAVSESNAQLHAHQRFEFDQEGRKVVIWESSGSPLRGKAVFLGAGSTGASLCTARPGTHLRKRTRQAGRCCLGSL